MTDFLVIGESVADIVRTPGRPDVPHPGGSPANVAYGLARLGRSTALLTQLGEDEAGGLIRAHLRSAGVELLADGQQGVSTPIAIVSLDAEGRAAYSFDIRWSLRSVQPPCTPLHVHLGSIAAVLEPGAAAALDLVERLRGQATVSYDPNIRADLLGEPRQVVPLVERRVALSDLVKASDEDVAWLYPGEPFAAVAARWLALGPAVVVITLGGEGALAFTRSRQVGVAAVRTVVVDTVGAGDSFMSATLDALASLDLLGAAARPALAALDAPEAPGEVTDGEVTDSEVTADEVTDREPLLAGVLRRAAAAAAITVSRAGANPPDARELSSALSADRAAPARRG